MQTALYLIPSGMSEAPLADVLPALNFRVIRELKYYVVENIREARRFLKRADPGIDIGGLTFWELNRHTPSEEVKAMLEPLRQGMPMGMVSDAGCPAVADPGALLVNIAQREGLKVIPLIGPSSILLSLMASGFNGQGFAFHGYLPIERDQRRCRLKALESESRKNDMTQIFIETPYRNFQLLEALCETLADSTMICVGIDITSPEEESIVSLPVFKFKRRLKEMEERLHKKPAVFLVYAGGEGALQQRKRAHNGKDK